MMWIRNYVVFIRNEKVRFEEHSYKPNGYKIVGRSPSTMNTQLKTLRVRFRFFVNEGLIEENPMKQVVLPRTSRTQISSLAREHTSASYTRRQNRPRQWGEISIR
jgi:site-specific recombinase XerD